MKCTKSSLDFEIKTDHLILARRPELVIVIKKKKKKRTCRIVHSAVQADHRVKLMESEKNDKYLDIAGKLKKKLWDMKVTLGTATK